jgi:hypothetical protein
MHLFGEGLVRTVDNFGTTGEAPTHPELLDHLALYLQRNHWSLNALVRYITESNSYRMASRPSPLAADPDNRLLHSQRRRRLDANALRDTLLSTAGTLDLSFLGPNIQNAVDARDSNNTDLLNLEYGYVFADTRRSVYTPAFRNKRHELFDAFDFNDVNQSLTKRNTSSVSPQALYLLNSEFLQEQAAVIGKLAAGQGGLAGTEVDWLYQTLLGRTPNPVERERALGLIADLSGGSEDPKLLEEASGHLAHLLLASTEFLYLE